MRVLFVFLSIVPVAVLGASSHALVTYLDLPDNTRTTALATDTAGNFLVASYGLKQSGRQTFRITKTDPQGRALASMDFGTSSFGSIAGLAIDANGDVLIAATMNSPDLTLVSQPAAFIFKIDSKLQNILFSTRLGGTQGAGPAHGGTFAGALAIDKDGNIYVTGGTLDSDFPVTPAAFQTQPPQGDVFGSSTYAFVTEISADGKSIILSTYFGTDHVSCIGGSHCIGAHGQTNGTAIALDSEGNIVIGGNTSADQLPVTAGVFGPSCGDCSSDSSASFLAKFDPSLSKLRWATYLPVAAGIPFTGLALNAMALDSNGNIIVGGSTPGPFPVTAHSLQPTFPVGEFPGSAGFIAKLDSAAQQLLFSTYFGGQYYQGVLGLTVDSQGAIWITGYSEPDELPSPPGTPALGPTYIAALSPDGSALTSIFTAPGNAAGQAIALTSGGASTALGFTGSLITVRPGTGPSLVGVVNAAGSLVSPAVAPLELISLLGIGLGPSDPASAQVVNGVAPDSLSGVQVFFDGVAAPLLYVGPNQINAVVPDEVAGRDRTELSIITPSGTIHGSMMSVRPSQPQVFLSHVPIPMGLQLPGAMPAAAVNQDGTINSADNPAKLGSIVSVWATGTGAPYLPVSVLRAGDVLTHSLEVLYAGQAPGLVTGVTQINFRLPTPADGGDTLGFELQTGDAQSNTFWIYTKQ